MEPMDLLADTRRYLDPVIRQLAAIEAGAPVAKPLKIEEAIPPTGCSKRAPSSSRAAANG